MKSDRAAMIDAHLARRHLRWMRLSLPIWVCVCLAGLGFVVWDSVTHWGGQVSVAGLVAWCFVGAGVSYALTRDLAKMRQLRKKIEIAETCKVEFVVDEENRWQAQVLEHLPTGHRLIIFETPPSPEGGFTG